MKKLTFILECFEHKELKPYLLSLKGIKGINKVTIKNDNYNDITIYYDKNKITEKELKEIENKLP